MPYQPFILKYRPRTFDDVVGQEHVSRTLRNALASGRIVHSYVFTGPRGTGKTTMARILARALNCVNGPTPDPCGVCEQCVSIIEGRSMDIIEIDAASHRGIDAIRDLRESVKYSPSESRHKLYILDECHMLTTEANNALLKTLEEPPSHAYFALLTTEAHKILPTILSRCQRFDFRPVSVTDTVQMLKRIAVAEGLQVQDEALAAIAHAAEGGMRDAESIFEQVVAFSEGEVTLDIANQVLGVTDAETLVQIAEIIARQDLPGVFQLVDRLVTDGKNIGRLIEDLTAFVRDLLRLALTGSGGAVWLQLGPDGEQRMRQVAHAIGQERLLTAVHALAELAVKLRDSAQHALLLELALTELANPAAAKPAAAPRPAPAQAPAPAPAVQTIPAAPAPPAPQAPPLTPPPPVTVPEPQAPTRVPPVQAEAPPAPAVPEAAPPAVAPTPVAATPAAPQVVEAPPPPVCSEGGLTCEVMWSNWERVLEQLRVNVRAFLLDAVPTSLEGDRLQLSFPQRCQFHAGQVKTHAETIRDAMERVFGQKFLIETRLCDVDKVPPPGVSQAAPGPVPSGPAMAATPQPAVDDSGPWAPEYVEEPAPPEIAPVAPPQVAPAAPTAPTPVAAPTPPPMAAVTPPEVAAPAAPTAAPAAPAAAPAPAEFALQPGQAPQPPLITPDEAVAQTLSLFPGAQEVLPPEQNHQ